MYHWHKDYEKATTVCIIIDTDLTIQTELMNFLRTHKWSGRSTDVSFIPYKTNEVHTATHKVAMYKKQNKWASELKRIIVNVKNANTPFVVDGQTLTFQDWLCFTPFCVKRVILGVEVAPKNIIRVLFKQDDRYDVEHILQNLYQMTVEKFGQARTNTILDEQELQKLKSNYKYEINHSQSILQLSANPQGGSESSRFSTANNRKTNFHYGSYLDVAKGENKQTSEITNENDMQTITT